MKFDERIIIVRIKTAAVKIDCHTKWYGKISTEYIFNKYHQSHWTKIITIFKSHKKCIKLSRHRVENKRKKNSMRLFIIRIYYHFATKRSFRECMIFIDAHSCWRKMHSTNILCVNCSIHSLNSTLVTRTVYVRPTHTHIISKMQLIYPRNHSNHSIKFLFLSPLPSLFE